LARLTGTGTTERLTGKIGEVKTWYREADRLKKEFLMYTKTINKTFSLLRDEALTDHLTKLHNRHSFEQLTAHFVGHPGPRCVAVFNIDHFKHVNDRYGHDVGDEVLVAVSGFLKKG